MSELAGALVKVQANLPKVHATRTWAVVPDASSYYVSDAGEVVSTVRRHPHVLKPITVGAYKGFCLVHDDGETRKRYLHRLVLESFVGPAPSDDHEARHLDGDRENNRRENLRWGTHRENEQDKSVHGTAPLGERNGMAKLTREAVAEMRRLRSDEGLSYAELGRRYDVATMTAWRAVTGRAWT